MRAAENSLAKLAAGRPLREAASVRLFREMFRGRLPEHAVKAILLLLVRKGETFAEIAGCLRALRGLEPPRRSRFAALLDTCGTGGDGSASVNVSTLAAFVIAGAGVRVAKHGNRALSSRCGSSDLMEALGVRLDAAPARMLASLGRSNIAYFHAPFYHPVFSQLQPLRRRLRTRTIFNFLGPLMNPLRLTAQLVGVPRQSHIPLYARLLRKNGIRRALVCSSKGMDEISTAAPTRYARLRGREIRYGRIDAARLGFRKAGPRSYAGGSPARNKSLALRILKGREIGPRRDVVLLNAAAGLWIAGRARSLAQGVKLAAASLDSGRAYRALEGLRAASRTGAAKP